MDPIWTEPTKYIPGKMLEETIRVGVAACQEEFEVTGVYLKEETCFGTCYHKSGSTDGQYCNYLRTR